MSEVDTHLLAREFLVSLRGKRSQVAWSRRLGYRSNVAYTWEAGRRFPTVAETFRAVQRSGLDLRSCMEDFYGHERRDWLDPHEDLATPQATAAFMRDLKGRTSTGITTPKPFPEEFLPTVCPKCKNTRWKKPRGEHLDELPVGVITTVIVGTTDPADTR